MNFLLAFFLIFLSGKLHASPWSFSFNDSFQGWGNWGDGIASIDPNVGKSGKGSIRLSTDYSNSHTIHYNLGEIPNGTYLVSFYVRAENVLSDERNYSFWHFIDKKNDTENIFTDLSGSYEWRKVQYTVDVSDRKLLLWFRLKSTGIVWIDDFEVKQVLKKKPLYIEKPSALKVAYKKELKLNSLGKKKKLLDFENDSVVHPFQVSTVNESKKGVIKAHEFYDFKPSEFEKGDWSSFDYINLEVFNPNDESALFVLALGDSQSSGYWTELNHKSSLAPGLNRLSFPLKQFVGERGSHRFSRYLNLSAIKKWFVIVDPDKKSASLKDYWIDNVTLEKKGIPAKPDGVYSYDFTSQKNDISSNDIKIRSYDLYDPSRGYGFSKPEFWRVEDSIYAPIDQRYTIGITKGSFKVKLPNGKYTIHLNVERLGYWDVSFWSNREIYLNDKIVLKESRMNTQDFLDDYLIFSSIVPGGDDHPYDLYLNKIFQYHNFEVEVKNGELDIGFIADATGISLNHLVIANVEKKKEALKYLEALNNARKIEFDRIARKVEPQINKGEVRTKLIDLKLDLREDETNLETAKAISWTGVRGESLHQVVELRGEGDVSFKITGKDETFFRDNLKIHEIVPQIISTDLNHETYFYAGKFLKPFTKLFLNKKRAKYILLEIEHYSKFKSKFESKLVIKIGKNTHDIPITLEALPYDMPIVDFPVGYFGPNPLPFNYVNLVGFQGTKDDYRLLAIDKLAKAGFTTFAGLPGAYRNGEIDLSSLTRLVNFANDKGMSGTYFSYGGEFPGELLEKDESALYYVLNKVNARLVYTFSDEPGGYSNRVTEDLETAKKLKKDFPILLRGGFTNLNDKSLNELNSFFDYPFYSHLKGGAPVKGWGAYNAAAGTLVDPRFVLSAGLYYARKRGLTHYLEWHSSAIHNYPYYDLDGRESDIEHFMAAPNKTLYPTLKFIMARQGIQTFRKISLLDEMIKAKSSVTAKSFLIRLEQGKLSDRENLLMPSKGFDFEQFYKDLNQTLKLLK